MLNALHIQGHAWDRRHCGLSMPSLGAGSAVSSHVPGGPHGWGRYLVKPHGVGDDIVVVPAAGGLRVHLLLEDQSLCTANAVGSCAGGLAHEHTALALFTCCAWSLGQQARAWLMQCCPNIRHLLLIGLVHDVQAMTEVRLCQLDLEHQLAHQPRLGLQKLASA